MGMEVFSGKYISDLNAAWPLGTDTKDDGDGHLRGIKLVLQNTFTGLTGAVTATQAELNILDGVTASTAEINVLDGATAGTAVASKALVVDASKNINFGTGAITAATISDTRQRRSNERWHGSCSVG